MGLLRLWLALFVYLEHLGGGLGLNHFLTGMVAVRSFFIISGFLIQLVLLEKYYVQKDRFWQVDFWKSRFMRIYPLYWIVMLGSVAFLLITGVPPRWYDIPNMVASEISPQKILFGHGDITGEIGYIVSHIFIFGFDISQYVFYDIPQEKFTLITNAPFNDLLWGRSLLLVPQAWTIAIELWFYLLAPLILLRKTAHVILIAIVLFLIRHHLHITCGRIALDIFSELHFFIIGALGSRFYLKYLKSSLNKYYAISLPLLAAVLAMGLAYEHIPLFFKENMFYALVACSLPFIFCSFHKNRFDRFMGDLSYPLYLVHFLAFGLAGIVFNGQHRYIATLLLTLSLAILSLFLVERPVDKLRHNLFVKKRETYHPGPQTKACIV